MASTSIATPQSLQCNSRHVIFIKQIATHQALQLQLLKCFSCNTQSTLSAEKKMDREGKKKSIGVIMLSNCNIKYKPITT
jgi:hypothetical protein